jgi:hypothetical protein
LSIPACAFQRSYSGDADEVMISSAGYMYLSGGVAPYDVDLYAPVNLPDGATVTNFSVYYYDNNMGDDLSIAYARLFRGDSFITSTAVVMAQISSISTTGVDTTPQYSYDTTISYNTIDNQNRNYFAQIWDFQPDAQSANLRFNGCRIEYTMDTLSP